MKARMEGMRSKTGKCLFLFFVFVITIPILICGYGSIGKGLQAKSIFQEANDFFNQGKYEDSLSRYRQIIENNPSVADRVLFEMGIIYAYPKNEKKDYQKAL